MTTMTDSTIKIASRDLQFTFFNSGDLQQVTHQDKMINQLVTNPLDGSLNNLYLRFHKKDGITAYPLLGIKSDSRVSHARNQLIWEGQAESVNYKVVFTLTDNHIWFWDVTVEGSDVEVDVLYGQDLGLANRGAVRANEAYTAQYIDHSIFNDSEKGYVVCSRQNQPQQGGFPYLQQGSLTKAAGYSTDGFQFFGLSYKETDQPEALSKTILDNTVFQYEFAYTALQSERVNLNGSAQFVFYGLFKENQEEAVTTLDFQEELKAAWEQVEKPETSSPLNRTVLKTHFGAPLQTQSLSKSDIEALYPNRHQEEFEGNSLLSFFTDTYEHVVLKEKERIVERPHGHIMLNGEKAMKLEHAFTTTSYMFGVFNSQVCVGNTSFNKMLTNTRNPLNIMKTSGQRIYVEQDGVYRLLTMPSLFEMGLNYAKWLYKLENDVITVMNYTVADAPEVHLEVRSEKGHAYKYIVTSQVTMNNNEYDVPFHVVEDHEYLTYTADEKSDSNAVYPKLAYALKVTGTNWKHGNESMIADHIEEKSASLSVLELDATKAWELTIRGRIDGDSQPFADRNVEEEIARYREIYRGLMGHFHLSNAPDVNKFNTLAWWYTHNMLIHYASPHGLEQYGGAAWGTRDVCQGPSEYFMATHNDEYVKNILKTVYAHQYETTGNWPQWFMFDQYYRMMQEDCHGDIIVWPLKTLGDYIALTGDIEILNEQLPYMVPGTFDFSEETDTLLNHVKKQIGYIQDHFLHDTHLSSYGDGDWDDTLQPANAQLKQYMVSSWTVSLTYQAIQQLAKVLKDTDKDTVAELKLLAVSIQSDFNEYIMSDEVIPGFVYMEDPKSVQKMLHPDEKQTEIDYRLLPMNRGIISEMFSPEQAAKHVAIIQEHLACPDGVRLMNRPANYAGGVSKHFKRAEQASNFGREIGLQYVHAHIRFIEAMAKLGKPEETWHGLEVINPVGIQSVVPNAERRQSNAYFSSSDGKFNTRYDAQENFDKLRDGSVPVKGGWRIYSSGPGIYMNQLISNVLGIRREAGDLIIDPVLPQDLNGLEFGYQWQHQPVTFKYHLTSADRVTHVVVNDKEVHVTPVINKYRSTGVKVEAAELAKHFDSETNIIEIHM